MYQQGPGAVIGDIALLDDEPRSASVSTLEKTTTLVFGKAAFLDCLRTSPEMSINIIRSLTHRLRQATEGSRSLALDNVCLLYTSPSPRDQRGSRMPSSA